MLPSTATPLDQARSAWLASLRHAHAAARTAATARELAQGEWLCGDYAGALDRFKEAVELAPADPTCALALARAASMLGRRCLEDQALAVALRQHPDNPDLVLHAALRLLPAAPDAARIRLLPFADHPLCVQYAQALALLASDATVPAREWGEPRLQASWDGFCWLQSRKHDGDRVGFSIDVLHAALAAAAPDGLTLECGVYFGRSLELIAASTTGQVHGFDSFQGLPEAWNRSEPAGAYSTAGRLPRVAGNVQLHAGWFEETVPRFMSGRADPIRLLHLDCDLYSSTRTVLDAVRPNIVPGSIVLFDDLLGYPGYEQHELRALEEISSEAGWRWEVVAGCVLGREVAIRVT